MRLNILLLSCLFSSAIFLGISGKVYSHEDHNHSHSQEETVSKTKAESIATNLVAELVKKEKLESSWESITASTITKQELEGTPEWLIVFVNDAVTDISKQKLYVFLSISGEYLAANFSGK